MAHVELELQQTLTMWLERAQRLVDQRRQDKNKLYALHAPAVVCIGKGKVRKPYEFGVKVSLSTAHKTGLILDAKKLPNNPYDCHTLVD